MSTIKIDTFSKMMTKHFSQHLPTELFGYSTALNHSLNFQTPYSSHSPTKNLMEIEAPGWPCKNCLNKRLHTDQISLLGSSKPHLCHLGLPFLVGTISPSLQHAVDVIQKKKKIINMFAKQSTFFVTVQPSSSLKKNNVIIWF